VQCTKKRSIVLSTTSTLLSTIATHTVIHHCNTYCYPPLQHILLSTIATHTAIHHCKCYGGLLSTTATRSSDVAWNISEDVIYITEIWYINDEPSSISSEHQASIDQCSYTHTSSYGLSMCHKPAIQPPLNSALIDSRPIIMLSIQHVSGNSQQRVGGKSGRGRGIEKREIIE